MIDNRLAIVIPCLNEGKFIRDVVLTCRQHSGAVIVSDDGSTDGTVEKALSAGALVIRKPELSDHGVGFATMRAVQYIMNTYPVIVTLDGDGQHDPNEIPLLLKPIRDGRADLVVGSRFLLTDGGEPIPPYRKLGNNIITALFNAGAKSGVTDSQCCFRAYRSEVFLTIGTFFRESGFPFSIEVLVKARQAGMRITEVPVRCIYHNCSGDNSTQYPVRHGLSAALNTIKWRLWESRRPRR